MKNIIKSKLGNLTYLTKIHEYVLKDYLPILAFHRITENTLEEHLSLGVKEFQELCKLLTERFTIIPLSLALEKIRGKSSITNEIVITFDDGYVNNYDLAAPFLHSLNIDATFFITTQFMGTDFVPWWDREQGIRHHWMTWDHVRDLQKMGFEIGSHTRNHVDLGITPKDQAMVELFQSKEELEDQLSRPVALFAYPYGGVENICQENLELVKAAGYLCCCSCYGGLNKRGADPYSLRRVPVSSWYQSPHDFYFQLIMHRWRSTGESLSAAAPMNETNPGIVE